MDVVVVAAEAVEPVVVLPDAVVVVVVPLTPAERIKIVDSTITTITRSTSRGKI